MNEQEIENRVKQGIPISTPEMLFLFWRTKDNDLIYVLKLNFKDNIVLKGGNSS